MLKTFLASMGLVGLVGSAGCFPVYDPKAPEQDPGGPARTASGQISNEALPVRPVDPASSSAVFLDGEDAALLLDRIAEEGAPEQSARMHSCMQMKFDTLGRVLASRGVKMTNNNNVDLTTMTSA